MEQKSIEYTYKSFLFNFFPLSILIIKLFICIFLLISLLNMDLLLFF